MQRFAVIGLGRFGQQLARALAASGAEVMAIDCAAELVEAVRDEVTLAVRLDSTDEEALKAQGIGKVDAAIVGIGEDFEATVLTAAVLKAESWPGWGLTTSSTPSGSRPCAGPIGSPCPTFDSTSILAKTTPSSTSPPRRSSTTRPWWSRPCGLATGSTWWPSSARSACRPTLLVRPPRR